MICEEQQKLKSEDLKYLNERCDRIKKYKLDQIKDK